MIQRLSKFVLTSVALLMVMSVVGFAQSPTLMTRHTRDEVVNKTVPLVGRLSPTKNLHINLILQHRNQAELEQFLKDLQDPGSPSYRHFLTVEQFTEKYGPSREDYEAVKGWARQNGLRIERESRNRLVMRGTGNIG